MSEGAGMGSLARCYRMSHPIKQSLNSIHSCGWSGSRERVNCAIEPLWAQTVAKSLIGGVGSHIGPFSPLRESPALLRPLPRPDWQHGVDMGGYMDPLLPPYSFSPSSSNKPEALCAPKVAKDIRKCIIDGQLVSFTVFIQSKRVKSILCLSQTRRLFVQASILALLQFLNGFI